MSYQEFANFPFFDFGVLLVMIAVAVQILRGKFTLTGGLLELVKTQKSAFDQSTDPLVVHLAKIAHQSPDETQRTLEWLYMLATGEPLNAQAKAKLAESTAQKQLKDIDMRGMRQFEMIKSPLPDSIDLPKPFAISQNMLPDDPDAVG